MAGLRKLFRPYPLKGKQRTPRGAPTLWSPASSAGEDLGTKSLLGSLPGPPQLLAGAWLQGPPLEAALDWPQS